MNLAIQELTNRVSSLSREQLLQLDPEVLAKIDWLLGGPKNDRLDQRLSEPVASFDRGIGLWATAFTKTFNPTHLQDNLPYLNPFPRKEYLLQVWNLLLTEQRILIPKSRSMLASWAVSAYAVWRAQWFNWECILQTLDMDKVEQLLKYSAALWSNQPEWLKAKHPLKSHEPLAFELRFASGGLVKAIPSGADKWRSWHPAMAFFDEMAYMPDAEICWSTAMASSNGIQLVGVSTAHSGGDGFFATQCGAE